MKCQNCGQEMIQLFTSYVCDNCSKTNIQHPALDIGCMSLKSHHLIDGWLNCEYDSLKEVFSIIVPSVNGGKKVKWYFNKKDINDIICYEGLLFHQSDEIRLPVSDNSGNRNGEYIVINGIYHLDTLTSDCKLTGITMSHNANCELKMDFPIVLELHKFWKDIVSP